MPRGRPADRAHNAAIDARVLAAVRAIGPVCPSARDVAAGAGLSYMVVHRSVRRLEAACLLPWPARRHEFVRRTRRRRVGAAIDTDPTPAEIAARAAAIREANMRSGIV